MIGMPTRTPEKAVSRIAAHSTPPSREKPKKCNRGPVGGFLVWIGDTLGLLGEGMTGGRRRRRNDQNGAFGRG